MREVPALDGLRALAVTWVFLRHAAYLSGFKAQLPPVLGTFMLNGWIGVDLFFVLSGFLIARPFFWQRPFGWRPYLIRRALRILPVYLVTLVFVVSAHVLLAYPENLGWRVSYHLLFLQDYLPSDLLIVLWSLGVEEKFYLLTPTLLPILLSIRNTRTQCWVLVAVVLLGPLGRALTFALAGAPEDYIAFFRIYRSPFHACIDSLCMGVLLARLETTCLPQWLTPALANRMFYTAAAVLLAIMLTHEFLSELGAVALVLRSTAIAMMMAIIVGAAVCGGAPPLFEKPAMRRLGRISYSVYLIHVPLLFPCLGIVRALDGGFGLFIGVYAILTLSVSRLLYWLIEAPCNQLGKRMELRLQYREGARYPKAELTSR